MKKIALVISICLAVTCVNAQRVKFVKEFVFTTEVQFETISHQEMDACGIFTSVCAEHTSMADFIIQAQCLSKISPAWESMMLASPHSAPTISFSTVTDPATGELKIIFYNYSVAGAQKYRVIIE